MLSSVFLKVRFTDFWAPMVQESLPRLLRNTSQQFEARLVQVAVNESPSIFFKDLAGSQLLVPVAHGEGRMGFANLTDAQSVLRDNLAPLQYTDYQGKATQNYPANPNGSPLGLASLTSQDGRATIIMPHPERVFLTQQLSWHPATESLESPWMRMFQNARTWVG